MTPTASVAARPPRVNRAIHGWGVRVALVLLVAIAGSQYLAGFAFLCWIRLDPRAATPLTVARYAYYHGDRLDVRRRLQWSSGLSAAVTAAVVLIASRRRPRSLHGDARFARRSEIARAGLLSDNGIILGRIGGIGPLGGRYLRLAGQQGVALSAQPRSGKGVGVVIPNLLTWPGSIVCTDIKRENWAITAGYRRRCGQDVYLFDPLAPDGRTARWNPLQYVSEESGQRISDVQLIASMFFPDPVNTDPFWMASARSLFLGIALYLFSTPSLPRTIGEILRQGMANDEEGFAHHWKRVVQGRMSGPHPLPEQCVRALYDVIDLAPQTTSSIRKTFTSRLELWMNPVLDAATAESDFDLRALRSRPMSIYLGVNPKDLARLAPLMSLFFQQAIALQTDRLPEHDPSLKHQVLLVLDEFPALGPIPIIAKASGFLPGYNVRTLMIMQTLAQLRQVYGPDGANTLLKTLAVRIHFAPKDMDDAEEISRELGFTTVKVKSVSTPVLTAFDTSNRRSRSVSVSEQRRALLLAQEVREIGPERELVFVENVQPILAKKIRYYLLPEFRKRLLPPPNVAPISMRVALPMPGSGPSEPERSVGARAPAARTRASTVADIDRIDSLTLEDFDLDPSRTIVPELAEGERMTRVQLDAAVEGFLESLQTGRDSR
jgi:type IV secretion system protein VirD4